MEKSVKKKIKQPVKGGVAKVPVIMQMERLECGAACLAMILAYYKKWVPLEQMREDCGVSRDGAKAGNITKAARAHGLNARGYFYEVDSLKEKATFPCIIHWSFNHFVVLKGFKGNKVYLNDPARGDLFVSEEEFDKEYTGICLLFSPGEEFCPSGKRKSVMEFAARYLKGTGGTMAFVAAMTAIMSFIGLIMTGFSRFFLDVMLGGQNTDLLIPFIMAMSVFAAITILAGCLQSVYSYRVRGKFAATENTSYLWHVLRLPMKFFSQRMAGDIEQRRVQSTNIANQLITLFAPLAINSFMLVFYLIVMIQHSVIMTIVGTVSVIINVAMVWWCSIKQLNVSRVMLVDSAKLYAATVSGIQVIESLKAGGSEVGFFRKWAGYQAGMNSQRVQFVKLDSYLGSIPEIIISLVNNLILVMGVYMVMTEKFTPGMVLAFASLLSRFFAPAQSFVMAGRKLQEIRTQMERIDDVMNYPTDPVFRKESEPLDKHDDAPVEKLSGQLSIHDLSFGYAKLAPPLIEGIDLELYPGKSVAFVGGSGSGKSTIGRLISGLCKPWGGEILFDGKPISEIDRDVFTASVAVVNQDIIMFEDTISNNIRMWDRSIEDFDIVLAARDAQIHDDIVQRDGGYQHRMIEGGRDFSGGQKQRMEIARVLAQDPTLIILDEATSTLDAKTEYEVVRSIRNRGITSIVIAHRLSTIRDCDEIIVIDHGKVIERGTHEELMKNNGLYTSLVANE
ncbi:NHLM bacteriocin system ABC transporter, peptidase/ATP-binding protein [Lachnospiraceae bacterium JC7]|nr:NHLM bacteriocin system ABC transporter, peptidase/ATP-binding protein [Lachnospiraceae bacterium JC7]